MNLYELLFQEDVSRYISHTVKFPISRSLTLTPNRVQDVRADEYNKDNSCFDRRAGNFVQVEQKRRGYVDPV